jgi:hypothetical protein
MAISSSQGSQASKTPVAAAMRQAIQQMKASDVRQMSILANQLFESKWSLERNHKWKGQTKEAARQAYIQEFAQNLQEAQIRREQQVQPETNGKPMKLSESLRQLTETMKASDKRMEDLGKRVFDLRRRTFDLDGPLQGEMTGSARQALPRGK